MDEYVRNFLMTTAAKAQLDAMSTARQSGKKPRVKRTEHGDACKWCQSKVGTYDSPGSDVFERHSGCEGKITTEGYMSRNGLLGNYKKGAGPGAAAPIAPDGGQVVFRGVGSYNTGFGLGDMFGNALYVARDTNTAAKFGNVSKLSMPLKSKDILLVTTDNQLETLQLAGMKWAARTGNSVAVSDFMPAYLRSLGYKAVEVKASVDPLAGIAIIDPATIKKMQAQMK